MIKKFGTAFTALFILFTILIFLISLCALNGFWGVAVRLAAYVFQAFTLFLAVSLRAENKYPSVAFVGILTAVSAELVFSRRIDALDRVDDALLDFGGTLAGMLLGAIVLALVRKHCIEKQ